MWRRVTEQMATESSLDAHSHWPHFHNEFSWYVINESVRLWNSIGQDASVSYSLNHQQHQRLSAFWLISCWDESWIRISENLHKSHKSGIRKCVCLCSVVTRWSSIWLHRNQPSSSKTNPSLWVFKPKIYLFDGSYQEKKSSLGKQLLCIVFERNYIVLVSYAVRRSLDFD